MYQEIQKNVGEIFTKQKYLDFSGQ